MIMHHDIMTYDRKFEFEYSLILMNSWRRRQP